MRAGCRWGQWSSSASLATLVTLLLVPAIYHLLAKRAGMTGARDQLVDEALAASEADSQQDKPAA